MKRIAVVTSTRAEYGLLSPVIKELRKRESSGVSTDLIVTGTHLYDEYGLTVNDIDDRIDYSINIPVKSDSEVDISKNQAEALIKFSELFAREHYNAVLLLGDRYETLAFAIAAGNTRTPVFHLCGGDTTEGALDEWIRHAITKISYLHFVTNEESRKRVIQLGEDPSRVFNYGSTSIDNIKNIADMSKRDALASVGLVDCRYALCTYHPVTMNDGGDLETAINSFLSAIVSFPELQFIVTKSNADQGGMRINEMLDDAARRIPNLHVFASLGARRYLSLMRYSEFVIGNSSSGIIETPSFHVPTVNIGDRQRGRLQAGSIVNCAEDKESIVRAIKTATDMQFRQKCLTITSPYGDGRASERIASKTIEVINTCNIDLKKRFYNIG